MNEREVAQELLRMARALSAGREPTPKQKEAMEKLGVKKYTWSGSKVNVQLPGGGKPGSAFSATIFANGSTWIRYTPDKYSDYVTTKKFKLRDLRST